MTVIGHLGDLTIELSMSVLFVHSGVFE